MQLDVTQTEAAILAEILERALGDTREEIYKAEVAEYKATLKEREVVLTSLLQRLGARPVSPG